jgi:regulation of enolase protein 1 (concanavalin A-like superfamily)
VKKMKKYICSVTYALFAALVALHVSAGAARAQAPLPPPWQSADVGDVGVAGSAGQDVNRSNVNGAGSDIWGTADSFHFAYRPMSDGNIVTNTPTQDATNPFAKAGIMIRQSLDPGSPHVILDLRPDGNVEFMTRSITGGETTFIAGGPLGAASGSLQLIREHGVVTAVVCANLCRTLGTAPFPTGLAFGGVAVTSHDTSTLNHASFPFSPAAIVSTVPRMWDTFDVGDVGLLGDALSEDGTFTVIGAGSDIWGTTDSYRYVRNAMDDDGEITARVTSEQAGNPFAKAGLLIRSPDLGVTVVLDVRPNGLIEFMARATQGGQMQFVAGSAASFPVWLKLQRAGRDQFTASISSNGKDWQTVGSTTANLPGEVEAGLAVTSHDTAALNTSTFDHVLVASRGFSRDSDIGDVGIAGQSHSLVSAPFVIQGGGGDIWGTADAFNYDYVSMLNDGQMIVKVDGLDNTNGFAKAGIMIRESLDPSSAFVMVDVTPSSLVEVLTRPTDGAQTQWDGGLSPTSFPIWLKLTRTGNTYDAYASHDNVTWQHLTQAFATLPPDVVIGLAVTSHVRGTLTTATFDQLSR